MAGYSPIYAGSSVFSENLDWVFLVDWILLLFASISIIFYFNRYIGLIITFFLKLFVWNRYKIRIKIKAVKVSLLGGRLFFKNLTIITKNETVSVLEGTLTWRYWLNSPLRTDFELEDKAMDKIKNEKLLSRFMLHLYGLEVFVYNRVYAYENLMDFIKKSDMDSDNEVKELKANMDSSEISSETFRFELKANEGEGDVPKEDQEVKPLDIKFLSFLNALPITLDIKRGGIVFGNKNTSSILVLSFSQGEGVIDMTKAVNKLDPYKLEFKMNLANPKVLLKPNLSYDDQGEKYKPLRKRDVKALRHTKTAKIMRLYRRITKMLRTAREEPIKKEPAWTGLRQYINNDASDFEDTLPKITINHDEYAKYSEIVDAEELFFCYYYDVPGTVPTKPEPTIGLPDIGNGGSAPTYGLYLSVSRGVIHYGPWANRERVGIQKMLFPSACRNAKPFEPLTPGNERKYSSFKIKVHVADEMTIRVPFREFSKNTKLNSDDDTDTDANRKPPFGWVELRLQKDSLFVSETSYIPTAENGWNNTLRLEFVRPEVRSSTNHDIFFRADDYILQAEIGFPLVWNALTHWKFHNRAENAEIFLLREHIILMSDMVSDFAYGPPTPYELFRPFIYDVDIELTKNYKLYLNVNDNNVINNPLDFNDNVYLSFQGESLFTKATIPLTTIVKKSTCVSYELTTEYFDIVLDPPPWHTLNNFLKSKKLGRSKNFAITGSYTYHSIVDIGTVDTIVIDCTCENTVLELYGFVLRYMLKIKENYFGIHRIFKTLLEFTDELNASEMENNSSKKEILKPKKIENEMDLLFTFSLQSGCLVLPSNIYDCDSNIRLYFDNLDVDIRYTNYYMDLQWDVSEIKVASSADCQSLTLIEEALTSKYMDSKEDMTIGKLQIHGHRMFGLPPIEPTYFCKWDFILGKTTIVGRPLFTKLLITSINNLAFSLKDTENLFVPIPVVLNDIVVVTFHCPMVLIDLLTDDGSRFLLSLSPIDITLNDMANERYSLRLNVKIPNIQAKISNSNGKTLSLIETSVYFTNFNQKKDFANELGLQQEHIRTNDAPFHRLPFFITKERDVIYRKAYGSIKPSFSLPGVPPPLNAQSIDVIIDNLFESESDKNNFSANLDNHTSEDKTAVDMLREAKSYYTDSEYSPTSGPDPDYEYDNFIVSLSSVQGFINPGSLGILVDVFDEYNNFTMESLMDSLQIETIRSLRKLSDCISTVKNIRLVTPVVDIKWGQFEEFDSISELNQWRKVRPDYLELIAYNISSVISLKTTKVSVEAIRLMDRIKTVNGSITALHVKEINLNIIKTQLGSEKNTIYSKPLQVSLLDLESWSTDSADRGLLGSVNLRELGLSVDGDQLYWLANFTASNKQQTSDIVLRLKEIASRKDLAYKALVYHLTTAGSTYRIEHDPAVLTKPAYIMRSSKKHIRSNDSWKIVVRLRHIMQNLPLSWVKGKDELFRQHDWVTTHDPCTVVLNIFKDWRSWEFSDISDCLLFKTVFNLSKPSGISDTPKSAVKKVMFALESLAIKLTSFEVEDDYILLDYLNCSVGTDKAPLSGEYEAIGVDGFDGQAVDIVLSLNKVKDRISPLSLRLKDFISAMTDKESTQSSPVSKPESLVSSMLFEVSAVVHKNEHTVCIDKVSLNCSGDGFTLGSLFIIQGDTNGNLPFTISLGYDYAATDLRMSGSSFAGLTSKQGSFALSNTGKLSSGLKKIDLWISELSLKCDKGTDDYLKLFDTILSHEVKIVQNFFPQSEHVTTKKKRIATDSNPKTEKATFFEFPILFSSTFEKINWDLEVVSPVKYTGYVNSFCIDAHFINEVLISDVKAQSVVTNIISHTNGSETMLHFKSEISKLQMFAKFILQDNYNLLNILVRTDRAVLTVPQLIESLSIIYKEKPHVMENFKKLKKMVTSFSDSKMPSRLKENSFHKQSISEKRPLLAKVFFKNNYAAFITSIENIAYRMDTRNTSLSLFNYLLVDGNEVMSVRLHGEVDLPSLRFVVGAGNEEIPVVAMSLAVKVINPDNIEHKLQTLQVELRYCRIFLTPKMTALLSSMQKIVSSTIDKFKTPETEAKTQEWQGAYSIPTPPGSILGFFSIHLLAYNICIGWIFDNPRSRMDGITIGCERIFVVSEEKVGKLTFVDAYLSLAQGSSPSKFFSSDGEYHSPNRAFLPNMQFIYAIVLKDGQKNMHTTVTGEQLDMRFEADCVKILDELIKSLNQYKKLLDERINLIGSRAARRSSTLEGVSINKVGFRSIECVASFAGAKVMIYNSDAECLEDCSSFTLESPAIRLALEYIHTPDLAKKHGLKMESTTFASKNILYATCVPVIGKLYREIRMIMHSSSPDVGKLRSVKEGLPSSYGTLLDDIDFDLGIRIEQQEISLSCEPTAKVEASGSFQGLNIRVGSGADVSWAIWKLEGLQASLQHVYSRETSGSINMEEVIVTAFYNFKKPKKLSTTAFVSEVRALINVKQLQDLDLFKDIWVPKEFHMSDDDLPVQIRSKRIANHVRESSTASAMPWMIELLILKINCTINMGKSLGVLSLNMDRLWAVSKKGITWEQNLRLAINRISLTSEGRLGGELFVDKITLLTAISWMTNGKSYEHPLVVLSAGIGAIRSKSSLDFHTFFVCNIKGLTLSMFNKRGVAVSAHDSLFATADVESLDLYLTALTASNFWDIYNTLLRIHNDIQVSYKEVLRDSSNKESNAMLKKKKQVNENFAEIISGLTTNLGVKIGRVLVHIYPSSLMDSQVLVFNLGEADAQFFQNTGEKIENRLKLKMTDFIVSLSTFHNKLEDENAFNSMSMEQFFKRSREVKGGTIFVFPSMFINMDIWQDVNSNVIEYKYLSTFGGKVDIRWNLGSVNFIRDMWTSHANALSSRLESHRRIQARGELELQAASQDKSLFETVNIEDKLKIVESGSKYVYVPLIPMVAEAPQLKELGDATPPLEWFGVHRTKFPNVSHQMIIVPLQKMVHEVETQYGRILR